MAREAIGDKGSKNWVSFATPAVFSERNSSINSASIEHDLSRTLAHIESTSPSHLVIYTGSALPGFDKRQVDDIHPPPFSFSSNNSSAAADNDGIFHRYALFSTGLIVSLIVVLFLLVPIVLLAVRSLASIQSSVRLDAPKGPSLDKKNQ